MGAGGWGHARPPKRLPFPREALDKAGATGTTTTALDGARCHCLRYERSGATDNTEYNAFAPDCAYRDEGGYSRHSSVPSVSTPAGPVFDSLGQDSNQNRMTCLVGLSLRGYGMDGWHRTLLKRPGPASTELGNTCRRIRAGGRLLPNSRQRRAFHIFFFRLRDFTPKTEGLINNRIGTPQVARLPLLRYLGRWYSVFPNNSET